MTRCWISIGSNIDRETSIRSALRALRQGFGDLIPSPVYETEAVGFEGAPFYNLVVGIETSASVGEINAVLRAIEDRLGRIRGHERFTSRTLDLDLLTYGMEAGLIDGCQLPRDEILEYAFVLRPLADVAPEERHPVDGRDYQTLWQAMAPHAPIMRPVALENPLDA